MFRFNRKREYKEFLQSDEWKEKRATVKRRARNRCERCHQEAYFGHCHHLTYDFGWNCDTDCLLWVCEDCHDFLHGRSSYDPDSVPTIEELERRMKETFDRLQ